MTICQTFPLQAAPSREGAGPHVGPVIDLFVSGLLEAARRRRTAPDQPGIKAAHGSGLLGTEDGWRDDGGMMVDLRS